MDKIKLKCEKNKGSIRINNDSSVVLCLFIAEQPNTRITETFVMELFVTGLTKMQAVF